MKPYAEWSAKAKAVWDKAQVDCLKSRLEDAHIALLTAVKYLKPALRRKIRAEIFYAKQPDVQKIRKGLWVTRKEFSP